MCLVYFVHWQGQRSFGKKTFLVLRKTCSQKSSKLIFLTAATISATCLKPIETILNRSCLDIWTFTWRRHVHNVGRFISAINLTASLKLFFLLGADLSGYVFVASVRFAYTTPGGVCFNHDAVYWNWFHCLNILLRLQRTKIKDEFSLPEEKWNRCSIWHLPSVQSDVPPQLANFFSFLRRSVERMHNASAQFVFVFGKDFTEIVCSCSAVQKQG